MREIIRSIFIIIVCMAVLFVLPMIMRATIYAPEEINKTYEGLNFDFNNEELLIPVKVTINGTITKNIWLKPETFIGTISIDSYQFEITKPTLISNFRNSYFLSLDYYNKNIEWKLNSEYFTKHFGNEPTWFIYTDKKFSTITFVPMLVNDDGSGRGSSSEIITAPCNDREEAISITGKLRSGGI